MRGTRERIVHLPVAGPAIAARLMATFAAALPRGADGSAAGDLLAGPLIGRTAGIDWKGAAADDVIGLCAQACAGSGVSIQDRNVHRSRTGTDVDRGRPGARGVDLIVLRATPVADARGQ